LCPTTEDQHCRTVGGLFHQGFGSVMFEYLQKNIIGR
jgi:hypothetical protein